MDGLQYPTDSAMINRIVETATRLRMACSNPFIKPFIQVNISEYQQADYYKLLAHPYTRYFSKGFIEFDGSIVQFCTDDCEVADE